jgi:uncharacterized membrane protein
MLKKSAIGVVAVICALGLTACGGSDTIQAQTDTQGKQLMDLKEAYDNGVINQKEYEKAKKKILKG